MIQWKPSYQELQESADIKPEQLFKGKEKEIEEAQLPPPKKPKQKTMASGNTISNLQNPEHTLVKEKTKIPRYLKMGTRSARLFRPNIYAGIKTHTCTRIFRK